MLQRMSNGVAQARSRGGNISFHRRGARAKKRLELEHQREGEERIEAAKIPPTHQGHSLEGAKVALAYVRNFATNRHADALMFSDPDGAKPRVATHALC